MDDALLAGNSADEEDEGLVLRDLELAQGRGRVDGLVFFGVDTIVDNVDPLRGDLEVLEDVALGSFGDSDHGVGHFECRLLDPGAEIVAALELLALPRAQWFE